MGMVLAGGQLRDLHRTTVEDLGTLFTLQHWRPAMAATGTRRQHVHPFMLSSEVTTTDPRSHLLLQHVG